MISVALVTESTAQIKADVAKIKEAAEILVEQIEIETTKAQGQLEFAQPALDEAAAALNVRTINKSVERKYKLNSLLYLILDNYHCGYCNCKKIRKTTIFNLTNYGCVFNTFSKKSETNEVRF